MRYQLSLLCWSLFYLVGPTLEAQKIYDVKQAGADASGKKMTTSIIQSLVDKASDNGGGKIIFKSGIYLTGAIQLKSGVELHLEENAVLLGSTNPSDYFKLKRWKALIIADNESNLSITGKGMIDGQGRQLALHIDSLCRTGKIAKRHFNFADNRPKYYLRPQLIEFVDCKNIIIENVTLKNAACWVQTYHGCEKLTIDNIKIESDAYWNNDGIDIQDTKDVRISNCDINCADDGICLKSHHSTEKWCENILIENCRIRSSASAVKFGTWSRVGFRNVTIKNITVYDTYRSAIAIECVDGGVLENVLVDGIDAKNTGNAIFIKLGKRKTDIPGTLKNVTLKNINVEVPYLRPDLDYEIRGPSLPFFHNTFPSSITGIPNQYVENVRLENISISYPGNGNNGMAYAPLWALDQVPENEDHYPEFSMFGELPAWGFYLRHVKGITFKNISLQIEAPDYRPAIVADDVIEFQIEGMSIKGDKDKNQIILKNVQEFKIDNNLGVQRL